MNGPFAVLMTTERLDRELKQAGFSSANIAATCPLFGAVNASVVRVGEQVPGRQGEGNVVTARSGALFLREEFGQGARFMRRNSD